MKNVLKELWTWAASILLGMIAAILINLFIFQPTKIMGGSMEPTLHSDNRIYVSKLPCLLPYRPVFGEIVIIDSRIHHKRTFLDDLMDIPAYKWATQNHDHELWIKRIIGLPSDHIQFKNNHVYRNGHLLKENYINGPMYTPDATIIVPKDCVFVMGDNRNNSLDSREIGCIPIDHILGTKLFD